MNQSVNALMNDKGVCRAALASPGSANILQILVLESTFTSLILLVARILHTYFRILEKKKRKKNILHIYDTFSVIEVFCYSYPYDVQTF